MIFELGAGYDPAGAQPDLLRPALETIVSGRLPVVITRASPPTSW
ncbi:hypothetical protein [Streptomyces sp. PA5.6]